MSEEQNRTGRITQASGEAFSHPDAAQMRGFSKTDTLKMKGIAIGLLLFHHLFYSMDRLNANGVTTRLISLTRLSQFGTMARVCVPIFAFLSAFGLTVQYGKLSGTTNRISAYLKKYWLNLMKPFWFVWIVSFAASFLYFKNPIEVYGNPLYALLDFFGISDFFGTPTMVSVWWYMCFAQVVLLLVPCIAELAKKVGFLVYPLAFLLLRYGNDGIVSPYGGRYSMYFMTVILGVLCAEYDVFGRIASKAAHRGTRFLEAVAYPACAILILWLCVKYSESDPFMVRSIGYSAAVFCLCAFACKYLTNRAIEKALAFVGKHSGTMFMTHSFTYLYYPGFVYWSHNVLITWLWLFAVSLSVACALDKLYEICGTYLRNRKMYQNS